MKIYILILLCFFISACSESTNIALPKGDSKITKITWKQYQKYCGQQNIQNKHNFARIRGAQVTWSGTVYQITKDAGMEDNRNHAPKIIKVQMPNSKSLLSDVTLRLPKGSEKIYGNMKKGDKIIFRGKISYIGSKLNDHIVIVEKFKKDTKKK